MKSVDVFVALFLVLVGLSVGIEGFAGWNPVEAAFGEGHPLVRASYRIAGLCAVYQALQWRAIRRRWHTAPL
jgi:uncharacterized membrane protein YuzA (DUF378 family)